MQHAQQCLPHKSKEQLEAMLSFAHAHRLATARQSALAHSWQHQQQALQKECTHLLRDEQGARLQRFERAAQVCLLPCIN